MSTPRRGGQHHGDERAGTRAGAASRDNGGQGAGDLSFGSTAGPWIAFDPPHPWAPPEHARAPVFAQQAPVDPFPWSTPTSFANPFHGPSTLNVPWGPPGEVPFAGFPAAGPAAPEPEWRHRRQDVFAGIGRRSVPAVVTDPDLDGADGGASCLPLARQAGVRAAARNNFIVSPLSFHAALALVAAGARGETQRELLGFLGSAESLSELHGAAATALVARLNDLPQTSFACGVWVDRRRALTPEFRDAAASRYAAVADSVDFASEPEAARRRVNAFVGEATRGLIGDVLPPGSVNSSTVLVLANAIYFKGTWARRFDRSRTFAAPFHLPGGATVRAPFMTTSPLSEDQQVAVFPGFKALKLPYKNDGGAAWFYMLLLLPDGEALTLSDLYDKAVSTPGFIRRHTPVDGVPVRRFMVPKFKFTFEFEASGDIQKLGVMRAFEGGDFSGMVSGGNGLFISGVYHKATVEVDEAGTVAAAATAVCMQQCARMGPPPVDFVADRPFLFAIVEERSGAVLFLGHVVNPLVG
ncbi:putative serpin-Z12 [Sorghum bicolor]|nr:putative serpin-Z12 [Sorghum bicolor]|eukprot:XP_002455425.1 putative serpin-Z12 [Sorghum bicolor]